jgi:hypothetical protein
MTSKEAFLAKLNVLEQDVEVTVGQKCKNYKSKMNSRSRSERREYIGQILDLWKRWNQVKQERQTLSFYRPLVNMASYDKLDQIEKKLKKCSDNIPYLEKHYKESGEGEIEEEEVGYHWADMAAMRKQQQGGVYKKRRSMMRRKKTMKRNKTMKRKKK